MMDNVAIFAIIWAVITILVLTQSVVNTFSTLELNRKVNNLNSQICTLQGSSCNVSDNLVNQFYFNNWDFIISFFILVIAVLITIFMNTVFPQLEDGDLETKVKYVGLIWAISYIFISIIIIFWRWVWPTWVNYSGEEPGITPLENRWDLLLIWLVSFVMIFLTIYKKKVFGEDKINTKIAIMWAIYIAVSICLSIFWEWIYPEYIKSDSDNE